MTIGTADGIDDLIADGGVVVLDSDTLPEETLSITEIVEQNADVNGEEVQETSLQALAAQKKDLTKDVRKAGISG